MNHETLDTIKRQARKLPLSKYIREGYLFGVQKVTPDVYTRDLNDWSAKFEMQGREDVIMGWDLMNEEHIISQVLQTLRTDDVFWDVGCGTGVYSCFALNELSDEGSIVGFEPNPSRREKTLRNVELNNGRDRFEACEMALSDEDGTAILSQKDHHVDLSRMSTGEEIETIEGDSLIKNSQVTAPTVLKLDIEGGELDALRGLRTTLLSGFTRVIFCEVHPEHLSDRGQSVEEVYELLKSLEFEIKQLGDRVNNTHFIRAINLSSMN